MQEAVPRLPDVFVPIEALFDAAEVADTPTPIAPEILPATPRDIDVMPLLTPDNYIGQIRKLIDRRKALDLPAVRVHHLQRQGDRQGFHRDAREALADLSNSPNMDVRIIVGSTGAADKIRKLVEAGFKETVFRSAEQHPQQGHCR